MTEQTVLPRLARAVTPSDPSLQAGGAAALLALGLLFVAAPVLALLSRSLYDNTGLWVGLDNYALWLQTPSLLDAAWRSLRLAGLSALITVTLAYGYAYALTMSAMPLKRLFRSVALAPLLAPSLLMAISLVYMFGNQGLLKGLLGGSIYGEPGIVTGSVLWTFPHALLLLTTSLSTLDGRLIEAARTLGAGPWRIFTTVTLPASRYGVLMAFVVVFVLVLTDFGVPKVIGGQANVLATDLYKQVVGQQNFAMGAVVSLILLLPAIGAFFVERHLRRRQSASLGARATVFSPSPHAWRDVSLLMYCGCVALSLLAVIGVAVFAALATYWPYNLQPSLKNFDFNQMDGGGWVTYWNSLRMALGTAVAGTALAFLTAWTVEKPRRFGPLREALNLVATLPLAVPGLALGLGYILWFNKPSNPLHGLYATMGLLIACTVAHYFSVAHLTLLGALRQLDREFEVVAESMGVPFWKTLWCVYLPVCLPALLEVAGFFFVNAMTTVSAVVFLYAPHTQLASVAVLNMDDAGDVAPAAAMAVLIFATAGATRLLFGVTTHWVSTRTQRWRIR
ncbi:MAG: putative 2-aminoethylphosphonate ABC transporter permease subunit [Burkholderiaceae bacterium]|nr:putative 2-aminoethylphosphonate ABC transporter permease subunit [Burkholderiaceae bacterium]